MDMAEQQLRLLAERIRHLSAIKEAVAQRFTVLTLTMDSADRQAATDALVARFGWDSAQAKAVLDARLAAFTMDRRTRLEIDLVAAVREFRQLDGPGRTNGDVHV